MSNGVAVAVADYFNYEKGLAEVAIYNAKDDVVSNEFSYNISDYKDISALPDGFSSPDIVIFHEVYKPVYLSLYKECIKKGIPYIVVPHGCSTRLSQRRKWLKKKVANVLLFNRFVKKSLAVQYLNEGERDCSIYKNHKYLISGNSISIKKSKNKFKNKDFVYIGRYSIRHKGLDLLAESIAKNKKWFRDNNVRVQLYGKDSEQERQKLEKMISDRGISDLLLLNDAVYGDVKQKILLGAYVFIQPSRWEGQPMAVMEALSYGLPCIATFNTSFGDYINEKQCGVGVTFNADELFMAMKQMFEDEKFRNKCAKNTKVIERDFFGPDVAKRCINDYRGML